MLIFIVIMKQVKSNQASVKKGDNQFQVFQSCHGAEFTNPIVADICGRLFRDELNFDRIEGLSVNLECPI